MKTPMFPAFGAAVQQWMWAALAGAVRLVNTTLTSTVNTVPSKMTVAVPVAGEAFGGDSLAPLRIAVKVTGLAWAAGTPKTDAAKAIIITSFFTMFLLVEWASGKLSAQIPPNALSKNRTDK